MSRIDIENGKYTIINNNGILTILRYGEDWHYDSDKFTLCLVQTIEQQQEEIEQLYESGAEHVAEIERLKGEIEKLKPGPFKSVWSNRYSKCDHHATMIKDGMEYCGICGLLL